MEIVQPFSREDFRGENDCALLQWVMASTSILTINDEEVVVPSMSAECPTNEPCILDLQSFTGNGRKKSIYTMTQDGSMKMYCTLGQSTLRRWIPIKRKWTAMRLDLTEDGLFQFGLGAIRMSSRYLLMDPGMRLVMHDIDTDSIPLASSPEHQLLFNLAANNDPVFSDAQLNKSMRMRMAETIDGAFSRALMQHREQGDEARNGNTHNLVSLT